MNRYALLIVGLVIVHNVSAMHNSLDTADRTTIYKKPKKQEIYGELKWTPPLTAPTLRQLAFTRICNITKIEHLTLMLPALDPMFKGSFLLNGNEKLKIEARVKELIRNSIFSQANIEQSCKVMVDIITILDQYQKNRESALEVDLSGYTQYETKELIFGGSKEPYGVNPHYLLNLPLSPAIRSFFTKKYISCWVYTDQDACLKFLANLHTVVRDADVREELLEHYGRKYAQFSKLKEFQHKVLKQHFKTDAIQFEFLSEELFKGACRFLIPQLSKALWEVAVEYQTTNKQGRPISNPRCAVTMVQRMISKTCNEKLVSKVLMLHNDYCIACNGKNMNLNKRGEAGDSCLHLAVRGAFDTYADAYQYQKVKKYYAIIQNLVDSGAKTTFRLHKDQASALECAKVLLGHEEKKALAMNRVGLEQPEAKERSAKVLDLRRDIVRFLESRSH